MNKRGFFVKIFLWLFNFLFLSLLIIIFLIAFSVNVEYKTEYVEAHYIADKMVKCYEEQKNVQSSKDCVDRIYSAKITDGKKEFFINREDFLIARATCGLDKIHYCFKTERFSDGGIIDVEAIYKKQ